MPRKSSKEEGAFTIEAGNARLGGPKSIIGYLEFASHGDELAIISWRAEGHAGAHERGFPQIDLFSESKKETIVLLLPATVERRITIVERSERLEGSTKLGELLPGNWGPPTEPQWSSDDHGHHITMNGIKVSIRQSKDTAGEPTWFLNVNLLDYETKLKVRKDCESEKKLLDDHAPGKSAHEIDKEITLLDKEIEKESGRKEQDKGKLDQWVKRRDTLYSDRESRKSALIELMQTSKTQLDKLISDAIVNPIQVPLTNSVTGQSKPASSVRVKAGHLEERWIRGMSCSGPCWALGARHGESAEDGANPCDSDTSGTGLVLPSDRP